MVPPEADDPPTQLTSEASRPEARPPGGPMAPLDRHRSSDVITNCGFDRRPTFSNRLRWWFSDLRSRLLDRE